MKRIAMVLALVAGGLTGCDEGCKAVGSCCKTCTGSKPCGDSCIARNQTCNKGGGCACGESLNDAGGK